MEFLIMIFIAYALGFVTFPALLVLRFVVSALRADRG